MIPCFPRSAGGTAMVALFHAASLLAADANAQTPAMQAGGQGACVVREQSRSPLTVDGTREMYVEPTAVIPSRGELLLAGSPNYLYAPGGPQDAREVVQDSVFGAILDRAGRGRLLPAPIDPTRVADIRGHAHSGGGWALTFAELKHPWRPQAPDTVVRYWYGVYDGTRWARLEPLPLPPAGELKTLGASAMLVRGDTTFFAVRVMQPTTRGLALYRRAKDAWDLTMLPSDGAVYITLAYSDSGRLIMGLVRPDRALRSDVNSFFIHTAPDWAASRKIIRGAPEPVYEPAFSSSPTGAVLTWFALANGMRRARAMVGSPTPDTPVIEIDSATRRVAHVEGLGTSPIWLSAHTPPDGNHALRFVTLGPQRGATLLGQFPNPYTGWFGVTATSADSLLISGPLLRRDSPNPSLVTLLIRARVECAVRAPRSDGSTLARRVYVHPSLGGLDESLSMPRLARAVRAAFSRLRR